MITATLPMFPLELVCFPGELLALHIFEDRYQQLIQDCESEKITFGIPAYINNEMLYGTEVSLEKVVKRYETGACDILCRGERVFKMDRFYNVLGDKLYAGADVAFISYVTDGSDISKTKLIDLLKYFYGLLDLELPELPFEEINAFTYAHKMGLSLEQEYEILKITSQSDRYQYLIEHLNAVIPTVRAVNRTKELIQLNGHFKNFNPLDFKKFQL
ncbi:ATP-dependent protease [Dokdonia sinensis]|uniref:ATP-dependent protease n=1 Tax=Dokdonia sinensis TaxID=2479847 RepID=A0A3M0G5V8_9FLAO|nr:LON peptidase substrate-binding domain-containing protein [Dokdonia sinensis]RMB59477.1 ATP-dependent protease [Dokdonia sinensis]